MSLLISCYASQSMLCLFRSLKSSKDLFCADTLPNAEISLLMQASSAHCVSEVSARKPVYDGIVPIISPFTVNQVLYTSVPSAILISISLSCACQAFFGEELMLTKFACNTLSLGSSWQKIGWQKKSEGMVHPFLYISSSCLCGSQMSYMYCTALSA